MKPPTDLFRRLPSASELLENPRIKGLLDRLQDWEVTTGVRQFVERMRQEVSHRSLDAPIPSIGEIADRAARFILGRHAADRPQAINATGQLWPAELTGPPMADEALATLSVAMQHYHVAGESRAARLAAELAGGQSAMLFSTPAAAMLLAMSTLAEERPIVVARGELGTLDGHTRLTALAQQAGVELREVGATDTVELADYEQALQSGAGVVLRIEALRYALRGQTCRPALPDLVKLAEHHRARVVHKIGRGALSSLSDQIPMDVATASDSLQSGVDVVIARGDGYAGGPACGIAIGHRETIDRLAASPLSPAVGASPLVDIALEATLSLHRSPDQAAMAIPTLSLLATPLLNLRTRAERMAAQIAAYPGIRSAAETEIPAGDDLGGMRPLPSFGISVVCEEDQQDRLRQQLDAARPRVVGVWSGNRILLDLRTVSPKDDISLVSAFDNRRTAEDEIQED